MATIQKLEEIECWNLARELNKIAFSYFERIKSAHDFSLLNQMSRSCGSIMDNIAEGFGRAGNREFIQFLSIAKASAEEFRSQLYRALDRKYISQTEFDTACEHLNKTCSKIGAFMAYLNKSNIKGQKYKNN